MQAHDAKEHEVRRRRTATVKSAQWSKDRRKLFARKAAPKSGVPSIAWDRQNCCWHIGPLRLNGKRWHLQKPTSTPLDASPAEIERTRLEAVARLQQWRKEHGLPELQV